MTTPSNEHELLALIARFYEGQATEEERNWLDDQVVSSPQARRMMLEFMATEADVARHVNRDDVPQVDYSHIFEETALSANVASDATTRTINLIAQAIAWHRHPLRFLATAAMLTITLWGGWAIIVSMSANQKLAETPRRPSLVARAPFVAQIIGGAAQWSESSGQAFSNAHLRQGQRLELLDGWAKIRFQSGAIFTLQHPATIVIHGEKRMSLLRGLGRVEVRERRAKGFALSAPGDVELVDLGTEFVVDVSEKDGEAIVDTQVVEGQVQLTVGKGESRVLSAGDSARVEGQQVKTLVAREAPKFSPPPVVVNVDLGAGATYRGKGAALDIGRFWNNGADKTSATQLLASDGKTRTRIGFKSDRQSHGMRPGAKISLFDDYQFTHRGAGPLTLTIFGLDIENRYDIYLYTATTLTQGASYTLDGKQLVTTGIDRDQFVEGENYVRFTDVAPQLGQVAITLSETGAANSAGLLNGFQVVQRSVEDSGSTSSPSAIEP